MDGESLVDNAAKFDGRGEASCLYTELSACPESVF